MKATNKENYLTNIFIRLIVLVFQAKRVAVATHHMIATTAFMYYRQLHTEALVTLPAVVYILGSL
jgi:hypothetical protein